MSSLQKTNAEALSTALLFSELLVADANKNKHSSSSSIYYQIDTAQKLKIQ